MSIANTPPTPCYAVIFRSQKIAAVDGDDDMAALMVALAQQQAGFLGIESARDALGITVSYWDSLAAIAAWKQHGTHLQGGTGVWL
jgi:heme-degrading monooxygenase HmoA